MRLDFFSFPIKAEFILIITNVKRVNFYFNWRYINVNCEYERLGRLYKLIHGRFTNWLEMSALVGLIELPANII